MKRILKLLILCMFWGLGMVQGQSKYINVPDTVCMATTNGTADQGKFTSVNALMTGGTNYTYPAQATWKITTPGGTDADYNILYSANTAPLKATKLINTKSLTLEFLRPGTYTFKAIFSYKTNNGTTQYDSVTKKLVAIDCTISTCNGGYAVMAGFNEDFGTMATGITRRPYPVSGVVQYDYQASGALADEYYVISGTTQLRGNWLNKPDHTGNTNGAMMVVNSAYKPSQMYQKKVTGLCSGSVYNFSAWLLNVNIENSFESGCISGYQYAGVTFQVLDADNPTVELARFRTFAVSMMLPSSNYKWQRYGGQFSIPPGVKDVLVRIVNNKPGGCGNDIALDDISFTYCSPIITAGLGNNTTLKEVMCEGSADTLTSSVLPAGYFVDPVYQWEMSDNNGATWFNVPFGTTRDSLLKIPAGQLKGTKTVAADYLFRVRIYEKGLPDSLGCANPSSPIKITILPKPILSLTKSQVCTGSPVDLEASGGYDTFSWSDLAGYTGATRTITLVTDTTIKVFGYVFYGEGGGKTCIDSNTASIKVDDVPLVEVAPYTVAICLGEVANFQVNSALAGKDIKWYRGIKDTPGSPDTTLMPEWNGFTQIEVIPGSLTDTIFSVIVKSGTCTVSSLPLIVKITKAPPVIKFPPIISCASDNSTGVIQLPDSTQAGITGSWFVASYSGFDIGPDETLDDYVKINIPNKMNTKVTIPYGSTVVLGWIASPGSNTTCKTTSYDTLSLLNNPTYSFAGDDATQCGTSDVFTMTAVAPDASLTGLTAETGTWTLISGTATIADIYAANTTVTVPGIQDAVLQWTIVNAAGCTSNLDTVVLHKAPPPTVTLAPITICNAAGTFLIDSLSTTGTPLLYTLRTGTPNALAGFATVSDSLKWPVTASYPTGTLPAAGVYNFILTVSSGSPGCVTDIPFVVNITTPPTAATGVTVGTPNICDTGSTVLTVTGGSLGKQADGITDNGKWYWYAGTCGGTPIDSGASIIVHGIAATTTYYVRAEGICGSTTCATGVVTVYVKPASAAAGPDQAHCSDSLFAMAANKPTVGTGVWSVIAGTATFRTVNSDTSTVIVKAGFSATVVWTIINGMCITRDTLELSNAAIIQALAGPDQDHCLVPGFTLAANTPGIGTGAWSLIKGSATIALLTNPTSAATVATGDTAVLVWTITNGTCISTDTVIISNSPKAVDADAGIAQEHCGDSVFTMAGNIPDLASAVGTWTVVSPSTVKIAAAEIHKPDAIVNVPPGVTATLMWTIVNGTCSTSSNVTLTHFGPILGNTITAAQNLCATQTPAPLSGNAATGGSGTYTYQWIYSVDSISYTNVIGGTNTTYAPGVISQNTWFKRVVVSGACKPDTSNAIKLSLITLTPVVVSVPAAFTTDCIAGKDYRTMFGIPTFSHAPYSNEALTVTFVDDSTQIDPCTKAIRRTWTATDRCGLTTSAQQTITVVDKTAPVFTTAAPANVTVNCDAVTAAVNLIANDACAGLMSVTPIEVRQDIAGSCTYLLIRKWVVADNCGNVSDTLRQTVTVRDLTPPVFTMTQPANISVDCNMVPAKTDLTATDNCTPGVITVTPVDSLATISGGACSLNYRIIRKWIATDLCGNTTILRQTITVQDTSRPVFSIPAPASITVDCDKVPVLPTVTATDNCTAVVTVTVGQKKAFLSTTCSNNYTLTRTWTAKDGCGNTSIMSQVIVVQDTTRPVFNVIPPADTTVSCDAIPSPSTNLKATDNCSATSNVKISYTQLRQSITGACAGNYQLIRTWTAKDECGNSTVITQTITVTDTTKPVIDPAPADITVNCGVSIQLPATLYARDNCDATFPKKATMTEDPYTKDVCGGYVIVRRWTIADACGNQAVERVQTITVNPCPKPELDPVLPVNCISNTKFAILLKNKVSKPQYTLINVVPTTVTLPFTQTNNVFDLQGATQATFTVTDGVTGCVSDPVIYDLQYAAKPVVTTSDDIAICPDETTMLTVDPDGGTVRWLNGESANSIVVSKPGDYWVTVTRDNCVVTDTVKVTSKSTLALDLGPDRDICTGGSVVVDGSNPDAISYLWNDGTTDPVKDITAAGKYVISVMDRFCSQITMDSVNVTVTGLPTSVLPNDTTWCRGVPLVLAPSMVGATGIRWEDGSINPTYTVTIAGTYGVTVYNECGVVTDRITVAFQDCDPKPQFPNAFTPNGDGQNDIFKPVLQGPMYDYDLHIYNRWGEMIFVSKEAQIGWNGKYAEKLVENGTYVWILSYKKTMGGAVIVAKGNITVLK